MDFSTSPSTGPEYYKYKVFHDPIHKDMEIHPLCVAIIDTPEFQRLRGLKQMGTVSYVYPGATNCRFQHCIGVCHLAGRFVSHLMTRQPELGISERDVLCVSVAGLCHDIGHGPFSHLWERFLRFSDRNRNWTHEDSSIRVFRHMVLKNKKLAERFFENFGDDYKYYLTLIEQQVYGTKQTRLNNCWTTQNKAGVKCDKSFLYEIVSNHQSGVDVDKWDYLKRDCHFTGILPSFDHDHLLTSARVNRDGEGVQHICFRDKEWISVEQMFRTRMTLHRVVYQHKVVKVLDFMVVEALIKADPFVLFAGKNGHDQRCLSEVVEDVNVFLQTNDALYYSILKSSDPRLKPAKEILNNIETRQLYVFVSQAMVEDDFVKSFQKNCAEYSSEIHRLVTDILCADQTTASDIFLDTLSFDYGMKGENPLKEVRFYSKEHPNEAKKRNLDSYSKMQIVNFQEKFVICFCRHKSSAAAVRQAFSAWCLGKGLKPIVEDDGQAW